VQSFPLADLLSLVHSSGKSGFLTFSNQGSTSDNVEKAVYLRRSEVIFAASNQSGDRLGECLMRENWITLEQLRETERLWSPNECFGKVLVERGVMTSREFWNGVKLQVEGIVRRCLLTQRASCTSGRARLNLTTSSGSRSRRAV
jgi:hypothetical protein